MGSAESTGATATMPDPQARPDFPTTTGNESPMGCHFFPPDARSNRCNRPSTAFQPEVVTTTICVEPEMPLDSGPVERASATTTENANTMIAYAIFFICAFLFMFVMGSNFDAKKILDVLKR